MIQFCEIVKFLFTSKIVLTIKEIDASRLNKSQLTSTVSLLTQIFLPVRADRPLRKCVSEKQTRKHDLSTIFSDKTFISSSYIELSTPRVLPLRLRWEAPHIHTYNGCDQLAPANLPIKAPGGLNLSASRCFVIRNRGIGSISE